MPRNNQRTDISRQEIQRLEAKLTSLIGRTARQASDSDELGVDSVDTANIVNDAVTEDKIADGAITGVKLASGGQYHGAYNTEAETQRSGATATTEIYYTARPDGDGYAENEVSDGGLGAGESSRRRLYYSDKFDADPDTSGDWTLYTTQPADDTAFATCKASLLAGLSDTDGTANTRGTLPVSLKMERTVITPLLLDTYSGAAAAYSVRLLRTDYTGDAIRIREDSGNTETDIGFDGNGDLDTAAIASHCGANNGYVVTWYDQSGNGEDVTQSTTTSQPQIYNGTATVTNNGNPALLFSNDYLLNTTLSENQPVTTFGVYHLTGGNYVYDGAFTSTRNALFAHGAGGSLWQLFATTGLNTSKAGYNIDDLVYGMHDGASSEIAVNGGTATTGNIGIASLGGLTVGARFSITNYGNGYYHEIIVFGVDQSANRSGIESNVNAYYSIY